MPSNSDLRKRPSKMIWLFIVPLLFWGWASGTGGMAVISTSQSPTKRFRNSWGLPGVPYFIIWACILSWGETSWPWNILGSPSITRILSPVIAPASSRYLVAFMASSSMPDLMGKFRATCGPRGNRRPRPRNRLGQWMEGRVCPVRRDAVPGRWTGRRSEAPRRYPAGRPPQGAAGTEIAGTEARGDANMPIRRSSAVWEGSFREGKGSVKLASGLLEAPYSAGSRFGNAPGTNPEELIGAAHAGCFSMALALILSGQKTPPKKIETTADVNIEPDGQGYTIMSIALRTTADVPGVTEADFLKDAEIAKLSCPVSKALMATKIT